MAQHAPAPQAQAAAAAAHFEHQFYVKQNESVRTLGADQIRLEVASGGVRPDALICKVGDSQWRPIRDAGAIGLELPSLRPSQAASSAVATPATTMDEPNPFARRRSSGRLGQVKNKGTLIVWVLSLAVGLTIILQRNGALYSMAQEWGLLKDYEDFEKSVFGGPGEGTARSAGRLFDEVVPSGLVPFSEIEARVKGQSKGAVKGAD